MKRILLILSLIIILLLCCACGTGTKSVVLLEDSVFMDSQNVVGDSFLVCFNYLYQGSRPNFEITEIDGEGLVDISYTCEDLTTDSLNGKHRGYRMGVAAVDIQYGEEHIDEQMSISQITFNVAGAEKVLKFKEPLTYKPMDVETNTGSIAVLQINSGCGVGDGAIFAFEAVEDIVLEGISLGKYLNLENIEISIDKGVTLDAEKVGGSECLPLEVKKGDAFVIKGTVTSDYFTGYQSIYTTSIIEYSVDGKRHTEHHGLSTDNMADQGAVNQAIDYILDNNLIQ